MLYSKNKRKENEWKLCINNIKRQKRPTQTDKMQQHMIKCINVNKYDTILSKCKWHEQVVSIWERILKVDAGLVVLSVGFLRICVLRIFFMIFQDYGLIT